MTWPALSGNHNTNINAILEQQISFFINGSQQRTPLHSASSAECPRESFHFGRTIDFSEN